MKITNEERYLALYGVPYDPARPPASAGKTRRRKNPRDDPRARAWRSAVLERDGFACVRCGRDGVTLHAHHVRPWADFPEERFDVSNGETLCESCHAAEHPEYPGLFSDSS